MVCQPSQFIARPKYLKSHSVVNSLFNTGKVGWPCPIVLHAVSVYLPDGYILTHSDSYINLKSTFVSRLLNDKGPVSGNT